MIKLFTTRELRQASLLLLMIIFMALLDTIGVASIMPFMAVLSNPDVVDTNIYLNNTFNYLSKFGVETKQQFLFFLGITVFFLLITSLTFKALTLYVQLRFTIMREYSIGKRLVEKYLHQPYEWFLKNHSADLGKTILSELNLIIAQGIKPLFFLIAQSVVAFFLILLLIIVDFKLALTVGSILSFSYALVYKLNSAFLKSIGKKRLTANQSRFTILNEAFGASKEVKIAGLEQSYVERFSNPAKIFARYQTLSQIITHLPRFALEAIAFGGLLFIILYLMKQNQDFYNILPTLSLYVFAGYRLMPALQKIYSSFTQIRFIGPSIDSVIRDLEMLKITELKKDYNKINFKNSISLNKVCYQYPNSKEKVLNDINLKIPVLNTVGLVGATGSGKTTTIDIILGLFEPQNGTLEVDDQLINKENRKSWFKSIGYVPQSIYLSDDTVAANIAFGVETNDINIKAVKNAAKVANLHNFVMNELSNGYDTTIGERGVRLSGGQRQRIGIARALYNNPQLLILDEATNALDNQTEKAVMDAVHNLSNKITIVIIAHRLTTLKKCDNIFVLTNGHISDQGNYDYLLKNSRVFKKMVEASSD